MKATLHSSIIRGGRLSVRRPSAIPPQEISGPSKNSNPPLDTVCQPLPIPCHSAGSRNHFDPRLVTLGCHFGDTNGCNRPSQALLHPLGLGLGLGFGIGVGLGLGLVDLGRAGTIPGQEPPERPCPSPPGCQGRPPKIPSPPIASDSVVPSPPRIQPPRLLSHPE